MKRFWHTVITVILLGSLTFDYTPKDGFRLTSVYAQAGNVVTISWTPPTQYTDTSPLLEQDLDFYTFYCNGIMVKQIDSIIGTYSNVVDLTGLPTADYVCHLTVTALPIIPNAATESGASNTINFTIGPRVPMAPAGLSST